MKTINKFDYFIDNFRGFSRKFISLSRVNFFVGENSSGKSSLIEVINVLGTEEFWYHLKPSIISKLFQKYSNVADRCGAGEFKPIRLGFVNRDIESKGFFSLVIEFSEKNNSLRLSKIFSARKDEIVSFDLLKKVVQIGKIESRENIREEILNWCETGALSNFAVATEISFKFPKFGPVLFNIHQVKIDEETGQISFPANDDFALPSSTNTFLQAPLRAKPKDFYEDKGEFRYTEDGEHSPLLLIRELQTSQDLTDHLNTFGSKSGLFNSISATKLGSEDDSPIKLTVEINNSKRKITQVGYGVGQIFPILTEVIYQSLVHKNESLFLIQQPEVHLHPKAQASFGEFIFEISNSTENCSFVIETHSDFLIDRFRICMRDSKDKSQCLDAKMYFFFRNENQNEAIEILISDSGEYPDELPSEYRDFFLIEQKRILGI